MTSVSASVPPAGRPCFDLWDHLQEDPCIGLVELTLDGTVLRHNTTAVRIYLGRDACGARFGGRSLRELFPAEWVDERLQILHRVARAGVKRVVRSIWGGYQLMSRVIPLADEADAPDRTSRSVGDDAAAGRFLVLVQRVPHLQNDPDPLLEDDAVLFTQINELGPLAKLTPRELEVLALIGRGLPTKAIADELHRAPKTIENHRNAIGDKLQCNRRLQLSEMAQRAGLRFTDGRRRNLTR